MHKLPAGAIFMVTFQTLLACRTCMRDLFPHGRFLGYTSLGMTGGRAARRNGLTTSMSSRPNPPWRRSGGIYSTAKIRVTNCPQGQFASPRFKSVWHAGGVCATFICTVDSCPRYARGIGPQRATAAPLRSARNDRRALRADRRAFRSPLVRHNHSRFPTTSNSFCNLSPSPSTSVIVCIPIEGFKAI
jgi:hypothetical protein